MDPQLVGMKILAIIESWPDIEETNIILKLIIIDSDLQLV